MCLTVAFAWSMTASVLGQEPKSSPLARALATALDAAKLDAIAAPDPTEPDVFVAALYIPGMQLLTVSAKYPAPAALRGKLATKAYRDIYLDLNGGPASVSRVFVEDFGADGLHGRQGETQPFDSYEATDAHLVFDSKPGKQKLTEQEYRRLSSAADDQYCHMLSALLKELEHASQR
jgi:hypothetical protein